MTRLPEEATNAASKMMQDALNAYLNGLKNEHGAISVEQLFFTSGGSDPHSMQIRMEKNVQLVTDLYHEFSSSLPKVAEMCEKEERVFQILSEMAFPYWFSREYFMGGNEPVQACSESTPLMCLPVEALAWIALWKQIWGVLVLIFCTLTLAAVLGKRKHMESSWGFVFVCFVMDVLSAMSLLVPVLGNVLDLVWAPLAGLIVGGLFKSWRIGAIYFAKELLIVADIIPMATMLALAN